MEQTMSKSLLLIKAKMPRQGKSKPSIKPEAMHFVHHMGLALHHATKANQPRMKYSPDQKKKHLNLFSQHEAESHKHVAATGHANHSSAMSEHKDAIRHYAKGFNRYSPKKMVHYDPKKSPREYAYGKPTQAKLKKRAHLKVVKGIK
jgi:hypothetical protein